MEDMDHSQHPTEEKIPETVTPQEYTDALMLLGSFKEKNLDGVTTLDELTETMQGLGDALSKITITKGRLTAEKTYDFLPGDGEKYKLDWEDIDELPEIAEGTQLSLRAVGGEFVVLTNKSVPYGAPPTKDDYEVLIPINPINHLSPHVSEGMVGAQAYNEEKGEWIDSMPLKQTNPEVIKKYAEIVKRGVTDLLATNLPPAAEVPSAFL